MKQVKDFTAVNCGIKGQQTVVDHLSDPILYMSNDSNARGVKKISSQWKNATSGPLFLIVSLTRKLNLLLGFTARCYSKGNMQSLQEQHTTKSEIIKVIYVLHEGVIQKPTHCEEE